MLIIGRDGADEQVHRANSRTHATAWPVRPAHLTGTGQPPVTSAAARVSTLAGHEKLDMSTLRTCIDIDARRLAEECAQLLEHPLTGAVTGETAADEIDITVATKAFQRGPPAPETNGDRVTDIKLDIHAAGFGRAAVPAGFETPLETCIAVGTGPHSKPPPFGG
jgi:hypothetical protein